jgi:uncharacterized membrane protein
MTSNKASSSDRRRPLHPPLVHAPIGGVVIAAACDLVSGAGGASHDWARSWFNGATYALLVGTVLLALAALAGFADRARQTVARSPDRAAVDRHAAVMSLMGVVCVTDLLLRTDHYGSAHHTPTVVLVLTLASLALATLGGELGGRLVYRDGIAVAARTPREGAGGRAVRHRPARTGRRARTAPAIRRRQARAVTTLAAWRGVSARDRAPRLLRTRAELAAARAAGARDERRTDDRDDDARYARLERRRRTLARRPNAHASARHHRSQFERATGDANAIRFGRPSRLHRRFLKEAALSGGSQRASPSAITSSTVTAAERLAPAAA